MGKVYHYHADVGANGKLNCGLLNAHDSSCSKGILTIANEDDCEKLASNFPVGKPHKCTHKVADTAIRSLAKNQTEIDIWLVRPRAQVKRPITKGRR